MRVQTATAKATFANPSGRTFESEITDLGGTQAVLGLANLVDPESEKRTSAGYEKILRDNDRLVIEKWNNERESGAYSMIIAEHFTVKVAGQAENFDELKSVMVELNLVGLERLRGEGDRATLNRRYPAKDWPDTSVLILGPDSQRPARLRGLQVLRYWAPPTEPSWTQHADRTSEKTPPRAAGGVARDCE